jgi:hypothetical protein
MSKLGISPTFPYHWLLRIGHRTLLLVNLHLDVDVEHGNDQVAGNVGTANSVEHKRIVKRDALRDLHHAKHDDKVRTVM